MDITQIKHILAQYKPLKSEYALFTTLNPEADAEHISLVRRKLRVLDALFDILPEEECFVVKKHIVEKLAWPLVNADHTLRWERATIRPERSLKRMQAWAIDTLLAYIEDNGLTASIALLFDLPTAGSEISTFPQSKMSLL